MPAARPDRPPWRGKPSQQAACASAGDAPGRFDARGRLCYSTAYAYGIRAMLFSVRLMRNRGRCLSARELANARVLAGDLRVEELRDETLRRHVRVARLVDRARPRDPDRLPPLYDVTLPAMSPQAFTLTGFERIEGTDYAQSWLITRE
jgi:hypothetical protein